MFGQEQEWNKDIIMKEFAPDIVPPSFIFANGFRDSFLEGFEEKQLMGALIQKGNFIFYKWQQYDEPGVVEDCSSSSEFLVYERRNMYLSSKPSKVNQIYMGF